MQAVYNDVREWLLTQQDWLQEAADRLLRKGALTDVDLNEICALLKKQTTTVVQKRHTFESLEGYHGGGGELRLVSVGDVQGIESLAPRAPLTFGSGNLVTIYGHNGSGKSSYTRILKKAAGKPRATELKPNVFQTASAKGKCQITYQLGEQSCTVDWHADDVPIDAIRALDIFDSDEANHYLSQESAATYTPPVVGMFEKLATVCEQIKAMLHEEKGQLVSKLPAIPAHLAQTAPAQRYKALTAEMAEAAVQQLLSWTEDDSRKLNELNERLKVADPAALAKRKRTTKKQVEQIIGDLQQGFCAYGAKGVQKIRELQALAKSKRKAAVEAAQVRSAKLEGVGTDTWRALWDAAKAYSQTVYPNQTFPVTAGALCVLCHQVLAPDAQQRLRDFEAFVQSKLEADADRANTVYQQSLKSLPPVPTAEQINTQCEAAGLSSEEWKQCLAVFWKSASQVKSGLTAGEVDGQVFPVQEMSENVERLRQYANQLEAQANQHDQDAQEFDRAKALIEKNDLEAKQWISQQADAVRMEIKRLKQVSVYKCWLEQTNSRSISLKARELSEKVITQAFVERFNQELKRLGAERIKVEIDKPRTRQGKVLHRLRLKGVVGGQIKPEAVLSEGERRIISLAAFLADVADKPTNAPFIFDDPISSLDHDFEWHVAQRLAELAKTRQVIVFTHRLSLYGVMEDAAKKIGKDWKENNLIQLCIERFLDDAGHPVHQATWNANTEKANNILLTRLDEAKKAGEAGGGENYRSLAQWICSDFRKLVERTVEDDLLYAVVRRHRRSITTDNKLTALSCIELDDCQLIDRLMTKYSCYEHSQSTEVPVFIPEEPELRADIEELKQWRKDFKKRQKEATA